MAKVSSTLVDFLENSNREEKAALFRELIKGQYGVSEAGEWLYRNWPQLINEMGRDVCLERLQLVPDRLLRTDK